MSDCGRFYFYKNGCELKSHPLNGAVFEGCGPYTAPGKRAILYAGRHGERRITTNDFGGESVTVKLWFPAVEARETFTLEPRTQL